MSETMLKVENVTMQFGGVVAVNNLSLEVNKGEIVALIGPNGAGKTTAFNCITGVYEPTNGRIEFEGKPMVENHPRGKMKKIYRGENADMYRHAKTVSPTPDKITKRGIARTFQNIRLWKSMTVFENVLTAYHMRGAPECFLGDVQILAQGRGAYEARSRGAFKRAGSLAVPRRACDKSSLRTSEKARDRACDCDKSQAFAFG